MGQTLTKLSLRSLDTPPIFDRRYVIEICEEVHVHYRNLRIRMSLVDWPIFARATAQAYERWQKRGKPQTGPQTHIELCRVEVAKKPINDGIQVNLNKNLYMKNEGTIFSLGADFKDPKYIHIKIRDLRLEMSINEFDSLYETMKAAHEQIHSDSDSLLQAS